MNEHRHGDADVQWHFDGAFWDEHYGSKPALWSGRPNPVLVDEVADLPPGRALDIGCGEGADAIWLAQHGWQVLGVDVSQVALDRAGAHVAEAGVAEEVVLERHDLLEWTPPLQSVDLVSAQFFQLPVDVRAEVYDRLAGAVASGGTLLIVAHHPDDLHSAVGRPPVGELFFPPEEIAQQLGHGWEVQVCEARRRIQLDSNDNEVNVTDSVLRARRSG